MKIVCNKKEFSLLVRACECNIISETCRGCLFFGLCKGSEDDVVDGIEDICEISVEG
jgi:hypothetical protein